MIVIADGGRLPQRTAGVLVHVVARWRGRRCGRRRIQVTTDEALIQHQRTGAEPDRQRGDQQTVTRAHEPMIPQPSRATSRASRGPTYKWKPDPPVVEVGRSGVSVLMRLDRFTVAWG